ncbi:hypothetical protein L210DRAFT_3560813 [Boletus edulis BED1]|uniref:DUF6533 domain-containing protein n=1 Tax=Boletus edulis BED1 TaxID=1328754 RepID=A0AAD4BIR3_BOLED|nr:hypothetical protein L210DRAFT_3560813 [Boletus edulis BED1]
MSVRVNKCSRHLDVYKCLPFYDKGPQSPHTLSVGMASLVSLLEIFQLFDYMLVASAAIVCYDYILTFPREMKPWSRTSTLFVVVMYTNYLNYSLMIMILRVSVMFTAQPERIRRILFFLYAIVTVNSIVFSAIWYGPHSGFSVMPVVINLEGGTACRAGGLFDILLLALAIYRFTKHCNETRDTMGSRSVLYFVLNFSYEALEVGAYFPSTPGSIPFMIYPRLVLSMRDQRAMSGGLLIGSEGSGYLPSYGHRKSPSVPVTESREHELSEGTSTLVSQHARPQSC